jgi:hypothetical protein
VGGLCGGNNIDHPPLDHGLEPFHAQGFGKDAEGFRNGDLRRRQNRELSLDPLVHDNVFSEKLAHEFDQDRNVDIPEIHRNLLDGSGDGKRRGDRGRRGNSGPFRYPQKAQGNKDSREERKQPAERTARDCGFLERSWAKYHGGQDPVFFVCLLHHGLGGH